MDVSTSRRIRISRLVEEAGGPSGFVERYASDGKWSPAQVSQWTSQTIRKNVGHGIAREIEKRVGLPEGSLDLPPELDLPSQSTRLTGQILRLAVELVRRRLEAEDAYFDFEEDLDVVAQGANFVMARKLTAVTGDNVLDFMKWSKGGK